MRKNLVAALFTLGVGAAAAAAIIATNAFAQTQPPAPGTPMLLAQATPAPARGPAARGPNARTMARPAPTAAQRTARRDAACQDNYARTAGHFAYLEARLNLTGAQTAAFARWRDLRLAAAKQRAGECAARPMPQPGGRAAGRGANATPPSPVDRLTREESMLQRRLSDIQTERPALETLYTSLSAAQRQTLARQNGFGGGGFRRAGFRRPGMAGPHGRMMMRRGPGPMRRPMGGPMRGPMGGLGMTPSRGNPPPPPAQ